MNETRWWERIIGALMLLGIALLVSGVIRSIVPDDVPAAAPLVRVTANGDPAVTHVADDRLIRVELDRLPQDYLVCLGDRCNIPAEWRSRCAPDPYGPGAAKIRVMTAVGIREFWITTIAGTAGVVFTPAELDPVASMR